MKISFTVVGIPQTKGSWRPGRNRRTGRVVLRPDNEAEPAWAQAVAWAARVASRGHQPDTALYRVAMVFRLVRPTSRRRTHRRDIDKLVRSCLDALTGIVWRDDEQVVDLHASKLLEGVTGPAGVDIAIDNL